MIHFTFTGYHAGLPFCDTQRSDSDTFMHIPYNATFRDKTLNSPDMCPACKEIYETAGTEEE